jgi:hypothetical protein
VTRTGASHVNHETCIRIGKDLFALRDYSHERLLAQGTVEHWRSSMNPFSSFQPRELSLALTDSYPELIGTNSYTDS